MACLTCERLKTEFTALELAYAVVLARREHPNENNRAEFSRLKVAVNEAFLEMELARAESKQHERWHAGI
jgi:hypothetical protein